MKNDFQGYFLEFCLSENIFWVFFQWQSIFLGSSEIPSSADPCLYVCHFHPLGSKARFLYHLLATSSKLFCSEQSLSKGGIEIAQLVANWLIRLQIQTCVKPSVTLDYSLAPKVLFIDWLKYVKHMKIRCCCFLNHQPTSFLPPKTVLLRTANLP